MLFNKNGISKLQTLIFQPLSREPTHAHHKQCVSKTFVITYAHREVFNPPLVDCLPENILIT